MTSRPWKGFRSVLCPIDFSATSQRALEHAAAVAARANARLVAMYVVDPMLRAAAELELHDRHFLRRSGQELRDFAERVLAAGRLRPRRVNVRLTVGDAVDEILTVARAADLIVMGTHGATGAMRLMVGSTTLGVLRRTTIPVLAIPRTEPNSPRLPTAGEPIVAAIELDARASRSVDRAATVAAWLATPLLLVHVVESIDGPPWMAGAFSAHQRIRLAQATRELDRLVVLARRRVNAEGRVVCGRPADEIAALVASTKSNLLITTLSDRRGWFGSRRGDVSYHVLSHAVVPVLACPLQWQPR